MEVWSSIKELVHFLLVDLMPIRVGSAKRHLEEVLAISVARVQITTQIRRMIIDIIKISKRALHSVK